MTPDKLAKSETKPLYEACDEHLRACVDALNPEWLIGIGKFAENQARGALSVDFPNLKIGSILHPSPASPVANRGWAPQAAAKLATLGIW